MFLKYPVFCRFEIRLATASVLSAMPSISTLAPWSFMLFSQTASVLFTVCADRVQQIDRAGLGRAQLVDHVHPALVVFGFALALQVARLHVGQFAFFCSPLPSWWRCPGAVCPAGTSSPR